MFFFLSLMKVIHNKPKQCNYTHCGPKMKAYVYTVISVRLDILNGLVLIIRLNDVGLFTRMKSPVCVQLS